MHSGRARKAAWLGVGAGIVLLLLAVLLALAKGHPGRLSAADQLASVASGLVGLVSLAVSLMSLRIAAHAEQPDPAVLLDRACEELARQVRQQWDQEAKARGLLRPEPLRVRWSSTGRPVSATPVEVLGPVVGRVIRLKLHGDVTEVADKWRQLPARQLVVIGAAGAGKTSLAVLLTLDLLKDRDAGEPVPVLMNLTGWDPHRMHVDTWLARQLAELYPVLTDRYRFGPHVAVRLVDWSRIIPVLDGLDEMPPRLRGAAVAALTDVVSRDRPLVLTCRSQEYQDTIEETGIPLARAAVVEIEPVTGQEASEYVRAGQVHGERRWAPVVEHLRAHPQGALAQTLSTPLMVYLARTAYTPRHTDPAALTAFTDPASVEEHLLQAYLPAIYGPRTPTRDTDSPPSLHDYPPDQARQWLAFLARHLQQRRSRDLHWWRLLAAVPRPGLLFAAVFTLVLAIAGGLSTVSTGGLMVALVCGLIIWLLMLPPVLVAASPDDVVIDSTPGRIYINPKRMLFRLASGLAIGLTIGLAFKIMTGLTGWLLAGTIIGVVVGAVTGFDKHAKSSEILDIRPTIRDNRTLFLALGLGPTLVLGLGFGIAFAPSAGIAAGFYAGCASGLFGIVGHGRTWFWFCVARFWLAATGRLPWRLMRFLHDAYHRGVLRRVGAAYQFRHARLQDYLASDGQHPADTR
ncbi:NACHT domain-containing protein [Micromonospora sagamiensis]|nr:NACHT domain-containing protein [Micromonospora sagamiensis]BCL16450.1 hypothetical protein GCM10017556_41890 [Micromonospora sagamiensis]